MVIKPIYIEEGKKNPQSIINFAHNGLPASDENYTKLSLLMDHLGGKGLESLLIKKIREEKGLTYGIHFSPVLGKHLQFLSGSMATDSKNDKEEIIREIKDIIKNLSANGMNQAILDDLKNKMKNKIDFYFKNSESIVGAMIFLQNNNLSPKYYDLLTSKIDEVDLVSINQFAKEFFDTEKMTFAVY